MVPRVGLNRTAIVQAGANLADTEGLEGVSLARLAKDLGIRPPSLYNHVSGLADLRSELAIFGVRELGHRLGRAAIGKSGDEGIETLAEAYRSFVKERPGLYAATLPASRLREPENRQLRAAEEEALEPVLVVLTSSYGLEDEEALHATRCLRAAVHGFATLEAAGGFGLALDTNESFRRLVRTFIGGLRRGELARRVS